MNEEKRIFEDNPQIAYLIAQKRFPIRYKPIKHDGKIKFLFSGPDLYQAVQFFFANDNIPVQDYLSAFSMIRNIVTAMKDTDG